MKLYALKSGYEGGMGILMYNYYDFIGLLTRFLLLNSLIDNKFKEYAFASVAGLMIITKMLGIPCNENFIYRDYLKSYYNQLIFDDINGNWTGSMLYPQDSNIWETIKNSDTIFNGRRPEIDGFRDTVILSRFENAHFSFNDSSLTIEKTNPELNGKYCLTYSQPESKYLVYLPCQYIVDAERDYHYNQYSLTVFFENISDSTLLCIINNEIELTLKTTPNK